MIDILYEDDSLVFINKPPGVVVQQRMHEPDEPFLHDLISRQVGAVFLMQRLDRGTSGVMFFSKRSDLNVRLTRQFEGCLIHTALELTRGRRIEAAQRLGIGRNTITRKIQELGLDD